MNQELITRSVENLYNNFQKEIVLYEEVFQLTQQEHKSIVNGALDETLKYVNEKQDILNKIELIEEEQKDLKKIWVQSRYKVTEEIRKKIRESLAVLGRLLEDLINLEKQNERTLSDQIGMFSVLKSDNKIAPKNAADAYKKNDDSPIKS